MADKKTLELQIKVAAENAAKAVSSLSSQFKDLAAKAKQLSGDTEKNKQTFASLQNQATKVASSFKLFGANSAELRNLQQQLKSAALDLTDRGFRPESNEVQNLVKEYKKLGSEADKLDEANGQSITSFGNLKNAITSTTAAMAALKALDVAKDLSGYALKQSDTFAVARGELGILLQDMEAGRGLFNEIQQFNKWTPFDLSTTKQATAVLLAAKTPLDDITDKLTMFGDLSQGQAQKFTSFINAYSKGAAKGAVDMEVLNVYLDQGVPVLDALAAAYDTTTAEIIKMASTGKISFKDFQNALADLTAEGGRYYGGMELGAQSLSAMQDGLRESVASLAASFGDTLMPAVKAVITVFTDLINAINDSPLARGILAGALVAITGYLSALAVKQAFLAIKTWASVAAHNALNASLAVTNPLLLAGIAAATAATVAAVAYAASQQKAADTAADAALENKRHQESVDNLADAYDTLKESVDGYNEALADIETTGLKLQLDLMKSDLEDAQEELENLQSQSVAETPYNTMAPSVFRIENSGQESTLSQYASEAKDLADKTAEAEKRVQELQVGIATLSKEINLRELNEKIKEGNELLAARDKIYAKTNEGQEEALKKQLEWALSLRTATITEEDGSVWGLNKEKTEAIIAYAQQALDDFNAKNADPEFIGEWVEKVKEGANSIAAEQARSLTKLNEKAREIYGDNFAIQKKYIEEKAALEEYYRNKAAEEERKRIINESQERMRKYKEEAEYQTALARHNIDSGNFSLQDIGSYASGTAQLAAAGTDIGQILSGGNPITAFIDAIADAVTQIENVNKVLNFAQTIVDAMFGVIEPAISTILQPLVDFLELLGQTIGYIIMPILNKIQIALIPLQITLKVLGAILKAVGSVYEWLNNSVIVPVGNTIIDVVNGIIDVINLIPFVDIDKLDKLSLVGEAAEEQAEAIEKLTDEITNKYQRQIDRANDLLDSQISSLQSQYELGLITRSQYNDQAEAYQAAADAEIYDIEQAMADALTAIEEHTGTTSAVESATYDFLSSSLFNVLDTIAGWIERIFGFLGNIGGGAIDAAGNAWDWVKDTASDVWDWATGWFDVGTPEIPKDMYAKVHKGETIIPATFAQGIRSGQLTLSGGGSKNGGGSNIYYISPNINIEGSVLTERELVDVIYNGINDGIEDGRLSPMLG
jgi:tape measure domain-containing protein